MDKNKPRIYEWIFIDEGGFTDDPNDNLGITTWGITIGEVREFRKATVNRDDMKSFSKGEAQKILDKSYWNPMKCSELPTALDYMIFDAGLMSGIGNGARWLQIACGTKVDLKIGPKTLAAAQTVDVRSALTTIYDLRVRRAKNHEDYKHFGRGWINRFIRVRSRCYTLLDGLIDDAK